MKISIITVVFNAERYLEDCIKSVLAQTYGDIEYIVIDGGSTDGTLTILEKYQSKIHKLVSEKDNGLYDAINKGIRLATGAIIGLLNADDMLADCAVIEKVAQSFIREPKVDGVYGDLNYIHPETKKIIRAWRSKSATYLDISKGWMPAHPTLYLRRSLFNQFGYYALDLGTVADYDLIIRYFFTHKIKTFYLPILMVNMRSGGASNHSISARWMALIQDYHALKRNDVKFPLYVLFRKKFDKLAQLRIK
ncbi:glycosyltransferase [Pedobacter changchengzhani]|uniref:Glycosyltransferase n=1 Tax=Pedobacter changchengzhani TaxID=2529274 RepID=A0A4R5MMH0_9SPHI|nr:glycosyltransferase family 2 protein [Pedobacter changchengzhani]TDG36716.1 glycosyltransferase [Pedobacter changchengzhani]